VQNISARYIKSEVVPHGCSYVKSEVVPHGQQASFTEKSLAHWKRESTPYLSALSLPKIPKPFGLNFGLVGIFGLLAVASWATVLPSVILSRDRHGNVSASTSMLALKPSRALDESGRFSRSCWTRARFDSTGAASASTSMLALKPRRALDESGRFSRSCWTRARFGRTREAEPARLSR
jgi:hypothetical protein